MSTKDDTNTSHPDGVSTGIDNDRGSSDNRTLLARVYQRWRIPLMCMLIRRLILRSSPYRKLQASWNATWVTWYGKRLADMTVSDVAMTNDPLLFLQSLPHLLPSRYNSNVQQGVG